MRELLSWWSEARGDGRAWLILGKGPSFDRRNEFDLADYRLLGLNHVAAGMRVDVASVMDMDVIAEHGEAIERNAGTLLMPRHPHVAFKPTDRPLESFFGDYPVLDRLARAGRLVWYNFGDAAPHGSSPVIARAPFSGAVMVNLLATLGIRTIRTLGVDGGSSYARPFDPSTKLANRQSSFDVQWDAIAATVRRHSIDYAPLTAQVPMRVYVGTDESQMLGARVLEYSIRRHCPLPLHFDTMDDVRVALPRDPGNQPRTGFSFDRFAIPERAGFKGRAVYLDADMLVLRSFQELWEIPFDGASVLYASSLNPEFPPQLSVLLLDCESLDWNVHRIVRGLDDGAYDYDGLMKRLCIEPPERVRPGIPAEWNSLEVYEPGRTGLLHYTNMSRQPWVSRKNPNLPLWVDYLRDAVDEGFIPLPEVEQAVERGFVRPSLLAQLRWPRPLDPFVRRIAGPLLDLGFVRHDRVRARRRAAKRGHAG